MCFRVLSVQCPGVANCQELSPSDTVLWGPDVQAPGLPEPGMHGCSPCGLCAPASSSKAPGECGAVACTLASLMQQACTGAWVHLVALAEPQYQGRSKAQKWCISVPLSPESPHPAPLEDALRLANDSSSHRAQSLFKLLLLHGAVGQVS